MRTIATLAAFGRLVPPGERTLSQEPSPVIVESERRYGEHDDHLGDLIVPGGEVPRHGWPVVVVVHGGFWRDRYHRDLTEPLARDLATHGLAAWNIEFRRVGGAGGWPMTFEDVASAIDHLAAPGLPVDPSRVAVVGHSAGGHLALWAAGRAGLPPAAPGAGPEITPRGIVGLAPVADLLEGHRTGLGDGAARQLLGADPELHPERWDQADPARGVGHGIPVLLVHGLDDTDVPVELSRRYAAAASAAGDPVELVTPASDHMTLIEPDAPSWGTARRWLLQRLRGEAGGGAPP